MLDFSAEQPSTSDDDVCTTRNHQHASPEAEARVAANPALASDDMQGTVPQPAPAEAECAEEIALKMGQEDSAPRADDSWVEGDRVRVDGRHAIVVRDGRADDQDLAELLWRDNCEVEEVKIDRIKFYGPALHPPPGSCAEKGNALSWSLVVFLLLAAVSLYSIRKVENADYCEYGTPLPGDVTAPNSPSIMECVAIGYGFLPYLCGAGCFLVLVVRRSLWPLSLLMMALLIVVINEFVFKKLLSEDRPSESCISTKGMPSSHSMLSIGFFAYFHIEVFCKANLTSTSRWSCSDKMLLLTACWILLLPVPFTRVMLNDHSWSQVGYGAVIGTTAACCWHVLLSYCLYQYFDSICDALRGCCCCWGLGMLSGFVNDYFPLPEVQSESQAALRHECCGLLPVEKFLRCNRKRFFL